MPSIYQRKHDGRWVVAWVVGTKRYVKYFATRTEAEAFFQTPVYTVQNVYTEFCSRNIKPSTKHSYEKFLSRILPTFGRKRIENVTRQELFHYFKKYPDYNVYRHTKALFNYAVKQGYITTSPVPNLPLTPERRTRERIWTVEQTQAFLDYLLTTEHKYHPLLLFLLFTGVRIGEALGLKWEDVQGNTVYIRRNLTHVDSKPVLTTPKTKSSTRVIVVNPEIIEMLPRTHEFVFRNTNGQPYFPDPINRYLKRTCQKLGLPVVTLHTLRHCHASLLLQHGVDLQTVSKRLGHARINITTLYLHQVLQDSSPSVLRQALLCRTSVSRTSYSTTEDQSSHN